MSSISGTVLNSDGRPLPGARVVASGAISSDILTNPRRRFSLGLSVSIDDLHDSPYHGETTTDAAGRFIIEGIAYSQFVVRATPAHSKNVVRRYYDLVQPGLRRAVALNEGEHKSGVTLTYDEGAAIWGKVTDSQGNPIPEATVVVIQRIDTENLTCVFNCNPDGTYLADGLVGTDDYLRTHAVAPHYLRAPEKRVSLESVADFTLVAAPRISGRVVQADSGRSVTTFSLRRLSWWEVEGDIQQAVAGMKYDDGTEQQDSEGRFSVDLKRTGDAGIAIRTPDGLSGFERFEDVQAGQSFEDVTIRVSRVNPITVRVAGSVKNRVGDPISGAWVFDSQQVIPGSRDNLDYSALARTDVDGLFDFEEAVPFDRMTIYHPDYAPSSISRAFSTDTINRVEILLGEGATISGFVSLDGDLLTEGEAMVSASSALTRIEPDGSYEFTRVSRDLVRISCRLLATDAKPVSSNYELRALLNVEDGQTYQMDFDFERGYDAGIEGIVLINGQPFPSARVELGFDRPDGLEAFFTTKSDETGHYWVDQIPEGLIAVRVIGLTPGGHGVEDVSEVETQSGMTAQYDVSFVE